MTQIFIDEAKSLQGAKKDMFLNLSLVEAVLAASLEVSKNQSPYEAERTLAAARQFSKTLSRAKGVSEKQ